MVNFTYIETSTGNEYIVIDHDNGVLLEASAETGDIFHMKAEDLGQSAGDDQPRFTYVSGEVDHIMELEGEALWFLGMTGTTLIFVDPATKRFITNDLEFFPHGLRWTYTKSTGVIPVSK